jgi:serine/threonine protein kinase
MGKRTFGKGKILGIYKILEPLRPFPRLHAYKARNLEQQRVVCLLTPADAAARRPDSLQQITNLVDELRRLEQPGIAQVYDFFEIESSFFVAMEYIPGANLETILQRMYQHQARPRFDEAMGVFRHVLTSQVALEERGICHRSLNPNWIYFRPEPCLGVPFCTVLTDLGVGYLRIAAPRKSSKSIAPSVAERDPSHQIYKLGVLLYRLITGELLYEETPGTTRLLQESPGVPEKVVRMIAGMLSQKPNDRFEHFGEIAEIIGAVDNQITQILPSGGTPGKPESLMAYYLDSLVNERSGNTVTPVESNGTDKIQIIGPGTGKQVVPANREGMTVGRVAGNDIVLNDLLVSRLHARILYDDESYQVIDLNSTNGTFLGDQKLLPGVAESWHPGTPLRLGDTVLRLLIGKDS